MGAPWVSDCTPRIETFGPLPPAALIRSEGTRRDRSWLVLMLSSSSDFCVVATMLIGTLLIAVAFWRSEVTMTSLTSLVPDWASALPPHAVAAAAAQVVEASRYRTRDV